MLGAHRYRACPPTKWDILQRAEEQALAERKRQLREKLVPIEGKPGFFHPNGAHALRTKSHGQRGQALDSHYKLRATGGVSVADQLKEVLCVNRVRVIDLFNSFDENSDGSITRLEFHRAFEHLGYDNNPVAVNELFASLDVDGSGAIEFAELNRQLRQTIRETPRPTTSASTSPCMSPTAPLSGDSPRPPSSPQMCRPSSRMSGRLIPLLSTAAYDGPLAVGPIQVFYDDLVDLKALQAERRLWVFRRACNLSRLQSCRAHRERLERQEKEMLSGAAIIEHAVTPGASSFCSEESEA